MSPEFVRAQFLRDHHRYEEAVALLHSHLARYPEDPDAFVELALNRTAIPGAEKQALEDARTASWLAPDRPFPLSLQARILSSLNRPGEAEQFAEAALAIEPNQAYYWNTRSIIQCDMGLWSLAEASARTALSMEPDDATASNLLSLALRRRNLIHASEQESRRRLQRDPESAFPFFNLGQAALRKKDFAGAESFFLEALRLNPATQNGRALLKEASRSRSGIFRCFLAWTTLWAEVGVRRPAVGMVLLLFGIPLCGALAEAPAVVAVGLSLLVYLGFFGVWLKAPLGDLVLLRSENVSVLLDPAEKKEALVIAGIVVGGWILIAIAAFTGSIVIATLGGGLWIACAFGTGFLTHPSKRARVTSRLLAGIFGALTLFIVCALAKDPVRGFDGDSASMWLLAGYIAMVGILFFRNPLGKIRLRSFLLRR
ncbi:MAG: Tetratricopeptide 1 repeat-containing protein [Akkermansiaceae bacterium]|nr:Tetratricopeptide 1 repeat-containing protein [Akkermansiaceae bacterium]